MRHTTAQTLSRLVVLSAFALPLTAFADESASNRGDPEDVAEMAMAEAEFGDVDFDDAGVAGEAQEDESYDGAFDDGALADGALQDDEQDDEQDDALQDRRDELDEMLAVESMSFDGYLRQPKHLGRLGPANPVRHRAFDALLRPGSSLLAGAVVPEGDAGALLAELGGIDLAELKARYDIPIELNDEVLSYIRFFQGNGRKWFSRWLARSHRWIPVLQPILAEEGLPLDTVYLAMIESGFSAYAYSWAKASGMWQFISATGKRYGLRDDFWVDERRDPVMATRAAARYLKALHSEFGHWYLAWAGYNAGEGKIRRAIRMYETTDFWELCESGKYLKPETKHYVPKLIAAAIIAKHPERFGFTDIEPESEYAYDEVEVPDATDLAIVAKAAGVQLSDVRDLNPALRRWATPPAQGGKGYRVKLPVGASERFLAEFSRIAPSERLTFRHHRVRNGETIGHIARAHGMPIEAIMRFNGISNPRRLRAGQDLIIPLPIQTGGQTVTASSTSNRASGKRASARQTARSVERQVERSTSSGRGNDYVIRRGDTLWSIARRFGVAVEDLKRWNSLPRSNPTLQIGQVLVVKPPAKKTAGG